MIKYAVVGMVCAMSAANALKVSVDSSCGPANFLNLEGQTYQNNAIKGGKSCKNKNGLGYKCCNFLGHDCHAELDISSLHGGHETYYLYVVQNGYNVSDALRVSPGQSQATVTCYNVMEPNYLNQFPCDPTHCE